MSSDSLTHLCSSDSLTHLCSSDSLTHLCSSDSLLHGPWKFRISTACDVCSPGLGQVKMSGLSVFVGGRGVIEYGTSTNLNNTSDTTDATETLTHQSKFVLTFLFPLYTQSRNRPRPLYHSTAMFRRFRGGGWVEMSLFLLKRRFINVRPQLQFLS